MSMGKGRQQETEVKLPKSLEKASEEGLAMAKNIAKLPYAPNFGITTAAFTPMQEAAFANTNQAAGAFGLPTASGTGLPKAENVGGFSGYSTQNLYNDSLNKMDPKARAMYEQFLSDPYGEGKSPAGGGGKGGASGSSKSGSMGGKGGHGGVLGAAQRGAQGVRSNQ